MAVPPLLSLDDALRTAASELDRVEANALADCEACLLNHGAQPEELQLALDWQREELVKLRSRVMEMIRVAWWTGSGGRLH